MTNSGPAFQPRNTRGEFSHVNRPESEIVLGSDEIPDTGFEVYTLDSYDPVDDAETAAINAQVQQMAAVARRTGVDVTEVGGWLREFDPNEKNQVAA